MAGPHVNLVEIESDRENSFLATHAQPLPGGNTFLFLSIGLKRFTILSISVHLSVISSQKSNISQKLHV